MRHPNPAPAESRNYQEKLRLQVAMLSSAADDPGPDLQLLEAMQGYNLLRTDQNGWIDLVTDGEQMWVEVESR
jgi:hypothetical protein